jgi:hypothetical protein
VVAVLIVKESATGFFEVGCPRVADRLQDVARLEEHLRSDMLLKRSPFHGRTNLADVGVHFSEPVAEFWVAVGIVNEDVRGV